MDNLFKQLRKDGIGAEVSTTEGITSEEENQLWESGVLNVETPAGLLNSVFYYCGKCFCLRGGQEHRTLSLSQFERKLNPDRYVYTENSSKNKQGGIKQMRLDHKVVTIVANPKIGERCPVYILDKYISKLPTKAKEMNIFYCRICPRLPKTSEDPWFIASPIGKNTLPNMVGQMCKEAGIDGKKSNHSLRVAGTSSLFTAGVPEKIIQSRTGHVSLASLRKYERETDEQELAVSKVLTGDEDSYKKAIETKQGPVESVSTTGFPSSSINYHNCTVNMQFSGPPMMGFSPYYPCPPCYYPSICPSLYDQQPQMYDSSILPRTDEPTWN